MAKYESYNEMLNYLYNQHINDIFININIEDYDALGDIKKKAIHHFVKKLRLQGWVIDERLIKNILYIDGQLQSKL